MIRLLKDPRDAGQLWLILHCTVVLVAAATLFYLGRFSWWVAIGYWALVGIVFFDRVNTMIHRFAHRPIFKERYDVLNAYVTWIIAPLFGQAPTSFEIHHVQMHHPEDNLPGDLSSTMRFRRDSALDFLRYFGRFMLIGIPELAVYHWRRGNTRSVIRLVAGQTLLYGLFVALGAWRLQPTLVVFVIPHIATVFLQLAGNWGQHAFVDPEQPDNDYRNSVTIITARHNRRCFSDGYHTFHHLRPNVHYSELQAEFEENREKYGQQDALVFDNISQIGIWSMLLTHRYEALARHVVRLPGSPERSEADMVRLLRHRVTAISDWKPGATRLAREAGAPA